MRTSIQRWHVGQLVMAWLAGAIGAVVLFVLGLFGHELANSIRTTSAYEREASLTRDWLEWRDVSAMVLQTWARNGDSSATDSTVARSGFVAADERGRVVSDLLKLRAAPRSVELVPRYLEREREEAIRRLTSAPPTQQLSQLLSRALGFVLMALSLAVPLVLFWSTWVWFDGRRPDSGAPAV